MKIEGDGERGGGGGGGEEGGGGGGGGRQTEREEGERHRERQSNCSNGRVTGKPKHFG